MIGLSPTRPRILKAMPEVVQAPAMRWSAPIASRPMVSWLSGPPGTERQSAFSEFGRGA